MLAIALLVSGCATTATKATTAPRPFATHSRFLRPAVYSTIGIAVEDATGTLGSRHPVLREIEDEVIHAAIRQGFTVAARSDIDRILGARGEAGLSRRGITEYAFAQRANALGVRALLIVSVTEFRHERTDYVQVAGSYVPRNSPSPLYQLEAGLSMRMIDSELAQVVHVSTYRLETLIGYPQHAPAMLPTAARTLLTALPARNSVPDAASNYVASRLVRATRSPDFNPAVHDRLAIYVDDRSRSMSQAQGALRQVEDEFMHAALRRGYALSARSDLESVLREIRFQNSGAVDDVVARAGRALGVPAVLIVTVDRASTSNAPLRRSAPGPRELAFVAGVSARMVSTERAQVLWLASHDASRSGIHRTELLTLVTDLATVVASTLPARSTPAKPALMVTPVKP